PSISMTPSFFAISSANCLWTKRPRPRPHAEDGDPVSGRGTACCAPRRASGRAHPTDYLTPCRPLREPRGRTSAPDETTASDEEPETRDTYPLARARSTRKTKVSSSSSRGKAASHSTVFPAATPATSTWTTP